MEGLVYLDCNLLCKLPIFIWRLKLKQSKQKYACQCIKNSTPALMDKEAIKTCELYRKFSFVYNPAAWTSSQRGFLCKNQSGLLIFRKFEKLKGLIKEAPVLRYYSRKCKTKLFLGIAKKGFARIHWQKRCWYLSGDLQIYTMVQGTIHYSERVLVMKFNSIQQYIYF